MIGTGGKRGEIGDAGGVAANGSAAKGSSSSTIASSNTTESADKLAEDENSS